MLTISQASRLIGLSVVNACRRLSWVGRITSFLSCSKAFVSGMSIIISTALGNKNQFSPFEIKFKTMELKNLSDCSSYLEKDNNDSSDPVITPEMEV